MVGPEWTILSQGTVRAISRVLPRAHLPSRDSDAAELCIPLYPKAERGLPNPWELGYRFPPFLIQSCEEDGNSQDWAILQFGFIGCSLQPSLYRYRNSSLMNAIALLSEPHRTNSIHSMA